MLHFTEKIGIYVPSTNYETAVEPVDFIARIFDTKLFLASLFGGFTAIRYAEGGWLTDDKKLINENVAIVYSSTDIKTLAKEIVTLYSYISRCFVDWQQYTLSLEINNELFIIDADDNIYDLLAHLPQLESILTEEIA